ncbi:regulator of (H+)-ATPase in vacuolar membrane [Malassezia sp. CBS 17886]|nr:regulator of (H+)-ATPase in vacuolar membrane [Malassezia sp. CBS 17886]
MADALPTLTRAWASLGASNAPTSHGPEDGPRLAAALNTFASFEDANKNLFISAQASGRRINVFTRGSHQMQCLSFDDVLGATAALRDTQVNSVALGLHAPASDHLLLAASFGAMVALWRLDALPTGPYTRVPTYGRWRLDSTLPVPGQYVTSLAIAKGQLAMGSEKCVSLWRRGTHADALWHAVWQQSVHRAVLCVRWSSAADYLAAVPLNSRRIHVWHMESGEENAAPTLLQALSLPCPVRALAWRVGVSDTPARPTLVVITRAQIAYLYATVVDEPFVLRHCGSVDAFADVHGMEPGNAAVMRDQAVLSVMYCDAHRVAIALQHDRDKIAHDQYLAMTGVRETDARAAGARDERRHRLDLLLARVPDLFLSVLADGSLVAHAVTDIDSDTPALLHTYVVLKQPPLLVVSAAHVPLILHFTPLPPSTADASPDASAVIHAQSATGLRGTMAVSLALLLDGDPAGLVVQDTLASTPAKFLRAQHKADIIAIGVSDRRDTLLSLSQDGVAIGWHLAHRAQGDDIGAALVSEHSVRFRGAVAACVLGTGARAAHALYTLSCDGTMRHWTLDAHQAWTERTAMDVRGRGALTIDASPTNKVAVVLRDQKHSYRVQVWDLALAPWGDALVMDAVLPGAADASAPVTAWSSVYTVGDLLAVSAPSRVLVYASSHPTKAAPYTGVGRPHWAPLAEVRLDALGSAQVAHMTWLDGPRLLMASACQLFLYHATLTPHRAPALRTPLAVRLAEMHALLPFHHPRHVFYCLQFGLYDAVFAILDTLARSLAQGAQEIAWDHLPWDVFLRPCPQNAHQAASVLSAPRYDRLCAALAHTRAPGLSDDETVALRAVVLAAGTVAQQGDALDAAGRAFLGALGALQDALQRARDGHTSDPATLPCPPFLFWGYVSAHQASLLSQFQRACADRVTWPLVRAAGLACWVRTRSALAPIIEQSVRTLYATGDGHDLALCTLLYLSLRKITTVRSLWRRASGHADQSRMVKFLANDLAEDRWRLAAHKNAYVLMSQRRFVFAAAFFLLGGALQDAVNVCVRNANDLPLALVVTRMYEDTDEGPVFAGLLRRHIVARAVQHGDRWLGAWALCALHEYADLMRMLYGPLAWFAHGAAAAKYGVRDKAPIRSAFPDPGMLLVYAHAKTHDWPHLVAPATEAQWVVESQYLFHSLGCDLIGLALLRHWNGARRASRAHAGTDAPTQPPGDKTKITALLTPDAPPPAPSTQGPPAFDPSAFGF